MAKQGQYRNPRFDVAEYENSGDWNSAWKAHNLQSPAIESTCYKSTLVAPMTLLNAKLDTEFLSRFPDSDWGY